MPAAACIKSSDCLCCNCWQGACHRHRTGSARLSRRTEGPHLGDACDVRAACHQQPHHLAVCHLGGTDQGRGGPADVQRELQHDSAGRAQRVVRKHSTDVHQVTRMDASGLAVPCGSLGRTRHCGTSPAHTTPCSAHLLKRWRVEGAAMVQQQRRRVHAVEERSKVQRQHALLHAHGRHSTHSTQVARTCTSAARRSTLPARFRTEAS